MRRSLYLILGCFLCIETGFAGNSVNPDLLSERWNAQWIAHPSAHIREYGVYQFRKTFELENTPSQFLIHVSADNRYRLFVNGKPAGEGPARCDPNHWNYETFDLTAHLRQGKNVIAATVWYFGDQAPWAQMQVQSAFILQGNTAAEAVVNTDTTWRVIRNTAYAPAGRERAEPYQFFVAGPGDSVRGAQYPWGWETLSFDDSLWLRPGTMGRGAPYGMHDPGMPWLLVPRAIPLMENRPVRFQAVRRTAGPAVLSGDLNPFQMDIPPQSRVTVLLDQGHLTTAYPELTVSGGRDAEITLIYAEALFDSLGRKGHRDSVENRRILGQHDRFYPDGGDRRHFRTLWFRTFRYIQLEINTGAFPVHIDDLFSTYTGYPFKAHASFTSNDPSLGQIMETGWRTARLCANETYYDCPYYEQMQYVGDTRIQALISLYMSGDDRLMRNAILQFNDSRIPEGLTASRYPSRIGQIIPPYSLFWIAMIHDFRMLRPDPEFVRPLIPGVRNVLSWYTSYIDSTHMPGNMPWWNFVDWPDEWRWDSVKGIGGIPDGGESGYSSILALQLVYALNLAADLTGEFGNACETQHYHSMAGLIRDAVRETCFDAKRGLLADTPDKQVFSQHANVMAVLTGVFTKEESADVLQRIIGDSSLIQCTSYFRFYLHEALKTAGLADLYPGLLEPWRRMLDLGLTTFAERPEPTRSDCHAWSASPNYQLFTLVCGITPASPGFESVNISPALGGLDYVSGSIPHWKGEIKTHFRRTGRALLCDISLPEGIPGYFEWQGARFTVSGDTSFTAGKP